MGYRNLQQCVADLEATGNSCGSMSRSIRAWRWPRFSGGCSARAGRRCSSCGPRAAASPCSATCSGRWSGCGICSAIRWIGVRRLVELQVDPADLLRRPRLYLKTPVDGVARPAAPRPPRPGARLPDHDRPAPAVEELAGRRRRLHHPAASLYRGPGAARPGAVEPGHVPRAAFGRAVPAQSRGGPALPTAPRHRRPPCGGLADEASDCG